MQVRRRKKRKAGSLFEGYPDGVELRLAIVSSSFETPYRIDDKEKYEKTQTIISFALALLMSAVDCEPLRSRPLVVAQFEINRAGNRFRPMGHQPCLRDDMGACFAMCLRTCPLLGTDVWEGHCSRLADCVKCRRTKRTRSGTQAGLGSFLWLELHRPLKRGGDPLLPAITTRTADAPPIGG